MPGASFIDTNIWVYAHLQDSNDPRCGRAWALVQRSPGAVISAQVTSEYFNVMRRNGTEEPRIARNLNRMLNRCVVQPMDLAVIRSTLAIRGRYGLSIWDSQIVAAALEAGCDTLYTEDLQDGQVIEGVRIVNPLRE
jgi:predicted nucleic acid-binding protein